MPLVVQKFGGTSVSTPERRAQVVDKILKAKKAGNQVVVVVSAMGRKGDPYATDTLLSIIDDSFSSPSPRTRDLIASCGEIISSCVLAETIESAGHNALPMTGFQAGINTNDDFTNGVVLEVNPRRLQQVLATDTIAVVAGFQGVNDQGDLVTLGRGGSDTTAIALGASLNADVVEIYTDVPGIAYTDPRIIPSAPFLKSIAFEPIYHLAQLGAKVIHHRAIETAMKYQRPFWVKSSFSDDPGTLVGKAGEAPGGLFGMALLKDVYLATRKADPTGELKDLAIHPWLYRNHPQRTSVITQQDKRDKIPKDCWVKQVSVITLQWQTEAGITPETVATALDSHGITREAYFVVPGGGAWAVEDLRSKEAMLALYRAPLTGSQSKN